MKNLLLLTCLLLSAFFYSCTKESVMPNGGDNPPTEVEKKKMDFEGKKAELLIFMMKLERGGMNLYHMKLGVTNANNDTFYIDAKPENERVSNAQWHTDSVLYLGSSTTRFYSAPEQTNCTLQHPRPIVLHLDLFPGADVNDTYNATAFRCTFSEDALIIMNLYPSENKEVTVDKALQYVHDPLRREWNEGTALRTYKTAKLTCSMTIE